MVMGRVRKLAGVRDVLMLVVGRAGSNATVTLAGIDTLAGSWVRVVLPGGGHALPLDALMLADGTRIGALDTVRFAALVPEPRPPFVEDAHVDGAMPPVRVSHLEERAISRTLAELAVPHLETLLPAGKRVLTAKDFQPGGRQRSVALIRPEQFQQLHLAYVGDDVRVGVSFRHRGQAYGGQTGLECTDLRLRAWAWETLRKQGTLTMTLDAKACTARFNAARFYLTIGLVDGAEGTFWPQVAGFHPVREYTATLDYGRL